MSETHVTKLHFVCQESDTFAVDALYILGGVGHQVTILNDGDVAPPLSVAVYTGYNEQWPNRHVRLAPHRLFKSCPDWAKHTPLVWSIRKNKNGTLWRALHSCAEQTLLWLNGELPGNEQPGGSPTSVDNRNLIEDWLDFMVQVYGEAVVEAIMNSKAFPKVLKGRGGDIVFNQIAKTGSVVVDREDFAPKFGANSLYKKLTGLDTPVVYGTSDIANVFELLQVLKLAYHLQRPAVFATYPSAHNISYWVNGFLNPSLRLLDAEISEDDLGVSGAAKYQSVPVTSELRSVLIKLGLWRYTNDLLGSNLASYYVSAMRKIADEVSGRFGFQIPCEFITIEDVLVQTGIWYKEVDEFAKGLQDDTGYPVVVLNSPSGKQFMTNSDLPEGTIAQLHEEGWWLGGAALYRLFYSVGTYGDVIEMVKDSTQGRVNKLALPYLNGSSGLRITPVGLFRLTCVGQNEDWSIDPLVFLQLLHEWGDSAGHNFYKIWDAMEVPMAKENVGRKTVATVSRDGVSVKVF